METAEHLLENALYAYHKAYSEGKDNPSGAVANDAMIRDQCEECGVPMKAVLNFVDYIYYSLLDSEEKREAILDRFSITPTDEEIFYMLDMYSEPYDVEFASGILATLQLFGLKAYRMGEDWHLVHMDGRESVHTIRHEKEDAYFKIPRKEDEK